MDKTAKRLKQRRRLEKSAQKREYEDNLVSEFQDRCKEHNVKLRKSRSDILRAYREIETDCLKRAMLISSVCTLYTLRKLYGFGKTRLYRMAVEFTVRIGDVGQAERKVSQMSEDLKLDAGLDCAAAWDGYTLPDGCKGNPHEIDAVLKSIPQTIPIIMYAVHLSLGFKKRRMQKVYELTCASIRLALFTDSIKPYLAELQKIGLTVNERGQYIASGKGIEKEHEKFMRRTGGFKNARNGISNFK